MNQPTPTKRQLGIFCFFSLSQAARDWSLVFKDAANKDIKHWLTVLHNAERSLNNAFKRELGEDVIAAFSEDAAMWTDVMNILTSGTTEEKARFIRFIKAYTLGEVKDLNEEQTDKEAA